MRKLACLAVLLAACTNGGNGGGGGGIGVIKLFRAASITGGQVSPNPS